MAKKSTLAPRQASRSHRSEPAALAPAIGPPLDRWGWMAPVIFLLATLAIYSNTWSLPFVFDDAGSIAENSTIRDLSNLGEVLLPQPRGGATIDGRPLLNFSLAVNYGISGLAPWSYHAANASLHFCNAWLLFGLLRRLLALSTLPAELNRAASLLAFCIALLWLAHPLQTAAITYVIQRAEALMALFYLATLYCFVRAATGEGSRNWSLATVACCWLGQGTKEIMATAPLAALAIDAALIGGSLAAALRERGRLHLALFASWFLAAALIVHTGSRSGTVGFAGEATALDYFVAQCGYLLRYLALVVWPWPQVFDYGNVVEPWDGSQWPQVLAILMLIAGILGLCWRKPAWGLLGLIPLLILAPTSSFIPVVTHVAAEHRMYLPLACVLTALVLLLWWALSRYSETNRSVALGVLVVLWAAGLGLTAHARNRVFVTPRSLWEDTLRACPDNMRVRDNLAVILAQEGEAAAAPALFDRAIAESRFLAAAYTNRARAWMRAGNAERGIADFQRAIEADPKFSQAYLDLSVVYRQRRQWSEALEMIEQAIAANPADGGQYMHRGIIHFNLGRRDLAEADYLKAVEMAPFSPEAHLRLGELQRLQGKLSEAKTSFETALYYFADYDKAELALVNLLAEQGDFRRALELLDGRIQRKDDPRDWVLLASVFEQAGDSASAARMLAEGVRRHPQTAPLRLHHGQLLARQGQWQAAAEELQTAERLEPGSADVAATLASVLWAAGDAAGAQVQLQKALAIDPRHAVARKLETQWEDKKPANKQD